MATYVPGSEQYLPDIKTFTPDYKFLSAVLDTRQDKYNTNWQATNDVYNKVVYAGLSRGDTQEQREQYINNLAPSLEKIAGMDLSLAQNAQSAKAVFAPFFESKLIVQDMVQTANYSKQMAYANRLKSSVDEDQRDLWWADGVKQLQYRMEDFINMSPDEALNAKMYNYTPDADLGKLADKMFSEMKPPLKMKFDHFNTEPDVVNADGTITKGKVNGDWLITTTNGEVVTGPALAMIQERLQDDPRVQKAYRTQAYVAGRDFAAEGMQAGAFSTVQEGQNAWAAETIKRIEENNNKDLIEGTKKLAKQQISTVRWSNYKKTIGVIPGSDDEKIMKAGMSAFETTSARLKNRMKVRDLASVQSPNLESKLNRAYQLLQLTNMHGDMLKAAKAYSMRDMESTMKETDASKERRRFNNDMKKAVYMQTERRKLAYDLARDKGEINDPNDPTLKALGGLKVDNTMTGTTAWSKEQDPYFQGVKDYAFDIQTNTGNQIKNILDAVTQLGATAGSDQVMTNVDVDGVSTPMNIKKLTEYLSQKTITESGVETYNNKDAITTLFQDYFAQVNDLTALKESNVDFATSGNLPALKAAFDSTTTDMETTDFWFKTASKIQHKLYTDAIPLLNSKDKRTVEAIENAGFGSPWVKGESGLWQYLSEEAFVQRAIDRAKDTGLENVNLIDVFDKGTNAEGFMVDMTHKKGAKKEYKNFFGTPTTTTRIEYSDQPLPGAKKSMAVTTLQWTDDTGKIVPSRDRDQLDFASMRRVKVLDEQSVRWEAEKAYGILSEQQNRAFQGKVGDGTLEVATYNSVKNRAGNTVADITNYAAIDLPINSEAPGRGDQLYAGMINQINKSYEEGLKPTFYITDVENAGTEGPLAESIFDEFNANWFQSRSDSRVSTNVLGTPKGRVVYAPVYGDPESPDKTKAAYIFYPDNDWFTSKVKGGGGDAQYAGLDLKTRNQIKENGITFIFDQGVDMSEGSRKNQATNNSLVAAKVEANDGYYSQTIPDGDANVSGSYSFQKINNQQYTLNYDIQAYVPSVNGVGGGNVSQGVVSTTININPYGSIYKGNMSILEMNEAKVKKIIAIQAALNTTARDKDVAVNGKK